MLQKFKLRRVLVKNGTSVPSQKRQVRSRYFRISSKGTIEQQNGNLKADGKFSRQALTGTAALIILLSASSSPALAAYSTASSSSKYVSIDRQQIERVIIADFTEKIQILSSEELGTLLEEVITSRKTAVELFDLVPSVGKRQTPAMQLPWSPFKQEIQQQQDRKSTWSSKGPIPPLVSPQEDQASETTPTPATSVSRKKENNDHEPMIQTLDDNTATANEQLKAPLQFSSNKDPLPQISNKDILPQTATSLPILESPPSLNEYEVDNYDDDDDSSGAADATRELLQKIMGGETSIPSPSSELQEAGQQNEEEQQKQPPTGLSFPWQTSANEIGGPNLKPILPDLPQLPNSFPWWSPTQQQGVIDPPALDPEETSSGRRVGVLSTISQSLTSSMNFVSVALGDVLDTTRIFSDRTSLAVGAVAVSAVAAGALLVSGVLDDTADADSKSASDVNKDDAEGQGANSKSAEKSSKSTSEETKESKEPQSSNTTEVGGLKGASRILVEPMSETGDGGGVGGMPGKPSQSKKRLLLDNGPPSYPTAQETLLGNNNYDSNNNSNNNNAQNRSSAVGSTLPSSSTIIWQRGDASAAMSPKLDTTTSFSSPRSPYLPPPFPSKVDGDSFAIPAAPAVPKVLWERQESGPPKQQAAPDRIRSRQVQPPIQQQAAPGRPWWPFGGERVVTSTSYPPSVTGPSQPRVPPPPPSWPSPPLMQPSTGLPQQLSKAEVQGGGVRLDSKSSGLTLQPPDPWLMPRGSQLEVEAAQIPQFNEALGETYASTPGAPLAAAPSPWDLPPL